mgnify:CR=1 FL=1
MSSRRVTIDRLTAITSDDVTNDDKLIIYDDSTGEAKHITRSELASNFSGASTDADAIHNNVDGEINAVAEKTVLSDSDEVLIEDSAASYAKKKSTLSSLWTRLLAYLGISAAEAGYLSGTTSSVQDQIDDKQAELAEGAFIDGDKTKLDAIESGAEANVVDSVNAKTGVVVIDPDDLDDTATTNKFTTAAEISKLSGIEDSATADQTGAEIKTALFAEADTNNFTDADESKLDAIESGATGDQTDAEIKTAYENNADTNAFTDADESKLDGIEALADVTDTTNVTAAGAFMKDGTVAMTGDANLNDNNLDNASEINFNTAYSAPTHAEGTLFYDNTNKALAFYNDEADVTLHVGQEGWIRVKNESGVTITNGQAVNITGSNGGFPLITLSKANASATANVYGFAAHDIEDNTYGYITNWGVVRDIDTSSFTAGDDLYLSKDTAGAITNLAPSLPNYEIHVGHAVVINASTGTMIVDVRHREVDYTDTFRILDNGDDTKQIAFEASSITTGTTRTLTVPDENLTLVGTAATQTLTNKTIDFDNNDIDSFPVTIGIACSDETTALTTGAAKVTFRMPYALTLTEVRATVTTAPTGSVLTVDINESGTTVLSTKLTIDATEKTSETAATSAVISDSALADDSEITIDIDGIGSTIAGAGLKVYLIGVRDNL